MQKTALYPAYEEDGAKVVDFNGWALPVRFAGIIDEHLHTRTRAGLFDCSHMSEFLIQGEEDIQRLDRLVFSDYVNLAPGRCRYSGLLDEAGTLIDDCVAFRVAPDGILLVCNAGTHDAVAELLRAKLRAVADLTDELSKIDIQGPDARAVLLDAGFEAAADLKFWRGLRTDWEGHEITLLRAGYTGELGYELYMPHTAALALWEVFLRDRRVLPCGLGARDTLRLEVCYPLSGVDFGPDVTPLEAGMEGFINWDKPFRGKEKLEAMRDAGGYARLTPIRAEGRQAPRSGQDVYADGEAVGVVTSGSFSPSLNIGIGLARIEPPHDKAGTRLEVGPRKLPVETAAPPLYTTGSARIKVG